MSLSWEREASESLVLSRHVRGPLLSYLLAPGTTNLRFEEIATRVVQENWEMHERAKERFRSSLNSSHRRWAKLIQELDELSKGIEAAVDRKLRKETETRMGVLQTTLRKVDTSIDESEDHLEESQMREEDAHQVDWGQMETLYWKEHRIVAPPVRRPRTLPYPWLAFKKLSTLWR